MPLAAPPSMEKEHQEIWGLLIGVQHLSGRTGNIAERMAGDLKAHIDKEESLALPLLGILREIVSDRLSANSAKRATSIYIQFQEEYPGMLHGHRELSKILARLKKVGAEEGHLTAVRLAEKLEKHSQEEEEVLYPAALLAGKLASRNRSRP
jgi:iron-sulfur cluster repair protein YtfE (RIC family)